MKTKKIIYFISSIIIVAILGIMAYIGIATKLIPSLPMPDIIANFDMFYQIFYNFNWYNVTLVLPLFVGAVFAFTQFCEKNWKLTFLILEVVFLVIIFLHGFGAF